MNAVPGGAVPEAAVEASEKAINMLIPNPISEFPREAAVDAALEAWAHVDSRASIRDWMRAALSAAWPHMGVDTAGTVERLPGNVPCGRLVTHPTHRYAADNGRTYECTGVGQIGAADDLAEAIALMSDLIARAPSAGEDQDGFILGYILPTGPLHRIAAYLTQHGQSFPQARSWAEVKADTAGEVERLREDVRLANAAYADVRAERDAAIVRAEAAEAKVAAVRRALDRVICATCEGSGNGYGLTPGGLSVETDCSDCDGTGGEWWAIDDAIHRGDSTRSPRADSITLAAVVRDSHAAIARAQADTTEGQS